MCVSLFSTVLSCTKKPFQGLCSLSARWQPINFLQAAEAGEIFAKSASPGLRLVDEQRARRIDRHRASTRNASALAIGQTSMPESCKFFNRSACLMRELVIALYLAAVSIAIRFYNTCEQLQNSPRISRRYRYWCRFQRIHFENNKFSLLIIITIEMETDRFSRFNGHAIQARPRIRCFWNLNALERKWRYSHVTPPVGLIGK